MDRIRSCDVDINLREMPIRTGRENLLYKTNDGQILKVFSKCLIDEGKDVLEKKLSNPRKIEGVVGPNQIVCIHDDIAGYTMDYVDGKHVVDYEKSVSPESRVDLTRIAKQYLELERIVKNAGDDVVFPGLIDKVFINDKGETKIVGYDSIQIGDLESLRRPSVSTSLDKYHKGDMMYTKDVDIKSLVWYYLRTALDLDLNVVEKDVNDLAHYVAAVVQAINLPPELAEKVMLLYNKDKKNEYLGDIVLEIAEKYTIISNPYCIYPTKNRLVYKQ